VLRVRLEKLRFGTIHKKVGRSNWSCSLGYYVIELLGYKVIKSTDKLKAHRKTVTLD
jgi:hypothetical protein